MSSPHLPGWGVVIPVKGLATAKSRLSTRPAPERRALALAFALDVVQAARDATGVGTVVVVAPDQDVRDAATGLGAQALEDVPDAGLVAALEHGVTHLRAAGVPDLLLLAGDLPALRAVDVELVLTQAEPHPRSFVSDTAGVGSTALLARGGVAPDPRFGTRSRAAHRSSGAVELTGAALARVRCDVDTEVDLRHARLLGVGARTAALLGSHE